MPSDWLSSFKCKFSLPNCLKWLIQFGSIEKSQWRVGGVPGVRGGGGCGGVACGVCVVVPSYSQQGW